MTDGSAVPAAAIEVPLLPLEGAVHLPEPAHPGDAGCDLFAREDARLRAGGGRALVRAGFAMELPEGTAALVLPRSGLAIRHGITCLNAPGLVDPSYRGEVGVILVNTDPSEDYEVRRGDRIAQLLVVRPEVVSFVVSGELSPTRRGDGGFGHTGR